MTKDLDQLLKEYQNGIITEVICGGIMNGSVIVLINQNNIVLTIQSSWRLSQDDKVLVSWNEESNQKGSNFVEQLEELEGDKIVAIDRSELYDLIIRFETRKMLYIFCDINKFYEADYFDENYVICDKNLNYCIGIDRELKEINRKYDTNLV